VRPVSFQSILFCGDADGSADGAAREPACFGDLNLNQIVSAVAAGREEYDLKPFFYMPLQDRDAIAFRHAIMRDLENADTLRLVKLFAQRMRTVREKLAQAEKRYNRYQKMRLFVNAVELYGKAVAGLAGDIACAEIQSPGLLAFRDFMQNHVAAPQFTALVAEANAIAQALSGIRYGIFMEGLRVEVRPGEDEKDYGVEIASLFERFEREDAKTYAFEFGDYPDVNAIEANILRLVAYTHRDIFAQLERYCEANRDFANPAIVRFDREIQFYVAYLDYIAPLKAAGLRFCYPRVMRQDKNVRIDESFDLALAAKLIGDGKRPVCNGFALNDPERIVVVSGPNQGGKTTFARMFGQLHYLARLGCPVPGTGARLYLADAILTHFERAERMTNLTGKLQDDLVRIHAILSDATTHSIVIINEIFTSTTLQDAVSLSGRIADRLTALDALCVWVTFIDEIASLNQKTVSMVSAVVPENPKLRTFKIVRHPADGLAYALSIARKYRLTHDLLKERIRP
jgi:DNA mismatch repair protein MutS